MNSKYNHKLILIAAIFMASCAAGGSDDSVAFQGAAAEDETCSVDTNLFTVQLFPSGVDYCDAPLGKLPRVWTGVDLSASIPFLAPDNCTPFWYEYGSDGCGRLMGCRIPGTTQEHSIGASTRPGYPTEVHGSYWVRDTSYYGFTCEYPMVASPE